MKTADIQAIIATNPDAVFKIDGHRSSYGKVVEIKKVRARYGGSMVTKVFIQDVDDKGQPILWKRHDGQEIPYVRDYMPAKVEALFATSLAEHADKRAVDKAAAQAKQAAHEAKRAAERAAEERAKAVIKDRGEDVIAGLANILGCKRDAIEISHWKGEVTITLAGDVAVNIVDEKAYSYC